MDKFTPSKHLLHNKTALWQTPERLTVRVILTLSMDSTSLLLIWAFLEMILVRARRRDGVLFLLNLCYCVSLFTSVGFFNAVLYLATDHKACAAVVGLSHMSELCTLAWLMLSSLHSFLATRSLGPEDISSRVGSTGLIIFYLLCGYGLPCVSLVTMMTHFYKNKFIAKTMCWLTEDAIWWLVIPILFYGWVTFLVALVALGYFHATPPHVKCQVYTCFILSMLFSCFLLVIQADMEWPSLANSYFLTIIMVFHNIIVWLHLTDTFPEICPCAQTTWRGEGLTRQPNNTQPIQMVMTASRAPSTTQTQTQAQGGGEDSLADPLGLAGDQQDPAARGPAQRPGVPGNRETSTHELDSKSLSHCDDMGAIDEDVVPSFVEGVSTDPAQARVVPPAD